MEPLLEASEAINEGGQKIPILTVLGRSYSQLEISTEMDLTNVQVLFTYKADGHN
ncbi:hypothetical protein D3C87_2115320 [compost metagenome]